MRNIVKVLLKDVKSLVHKEDIMKKIKTITACLLATMMLVSLAAFALDSPGVSTDGLLSVSGIVTDVAETGEGRYTVTIQSEESGTVVFIITPDTENIAGAMPEAGDEFTGYFDGSLPIALIYPPHYTAVAFDVGKTEVEVIIVVNGEEIEAPAPYITGHVVMVPLRPIAEALEFEVIWENATRSIYLNNAISLSIGNNHYTYGRMAPIELEAAPALIDGRTYVPLSFFREVVGMNNAFFFEGVIEINNDEEMWAD